jgi:hypothetical protein
MKFPKTLLLLALVCLSCFTLKPLGPGDSFDPPQVRWGYGRLVRGLRFRDYRLLPNGTVTLELFEETSDEHPLLPERWEGRWEIQGDRVLLTFTLKFIRTPLGDFDPEVRNQWGSFGSYESYEERPITHLEEVVIPLRLLQAWAPGWFTSQEEVSLSKSEFITMLDLGEKSSYWFEPQPEF